MAPLSPSPAARHPPGLGLLFFAELWERFAYYGLRALLILYLLDTAAGGLGWRQEPASRLYGWFIGLCYLTPVIGGWMADRFLGANRALVIGGAVIALGHFTLALGAGWLFFAGLGLIVAGTGFFKGNAATMVGRLYRTDDPRRDAGFTLYYVAINLGALSGPLVCAWLAADPRFGWRYAFGAAGTGMLLGLVAYLALRGRLLQGIGTAEGGAGAALAERTGDEQSRIAAIAVVLFFGVFFWLAFEQVGSSLNVFAAQRTDRTVTGLIAGLMPRGEIPAAWFQSVNPVFVLLLAPIVALLWRRLGPRQPSPPAKMVIGLGLLGLAYLVMVVAALASEGGMPASPLYLVGFYLLYSVGELCFIPVSISFVSRTAPARYASMLMGLWFSANFVASVLGGYIAGMIQRVARGELFTLLGGQADFFLLFVAVTLMASLGLALLTPALHRLLRRSAA
ncbi:MAG: peptide MFS transporter [Gemmatimonadales bacterium]